MTPQLNIALEPGPGGPRPGAGRPRKSGGYVRKPPTYRADTGYRNGSLVVVGIAPVVGDRYVAVKCDCGTRFVTRTSQFLQQSFCSNQCSERRRLARPGPRLCDRALAKSILLVLEKSSAKRLLPCTLSIDDLLEIRIGKACTYCEDPIDPPGLRWRGNRVGLDRIECDRGYERDNVVACCTNCNIARGHLLTVDEFRAAMQARRARIGPGVPMWPDPMQWRRKGGHEGRWS